MWGQQHKHSEFVQLTSFCSRVGSTQRVYFTTSVTLSGGIEVRHPCLSNGLKFFAHTRQAVDAVAALLPGVSLRPRTLYMLPPGYDCFFALWLILLNALQDLLMDWSLLRPHVQHPLLRSDILYTSALPVRSYLVSTH